MDSSIVILAVSIVGAIVAYWQNRESKKSDDKWNRMDSITNELSRQSVELGNLNKSFAEIIDTTTKENLDISKNVKQLGERTASLLYLTNKIASDIESKNRKIGTLDLSLPFESKKPDTEIIIGSEGSTYVYKIRDLSIMQSLYSGISQLMDPPKFKIENGKLELYVDVRSKEGEKLLSIEKSTWVKFSNDVKFNYDSRGIELINSEGIVLFNLDVIGLRIHMQGVFLENVGGYSILGKSLVMSVGYPYTSSDKYYQNARIKQLFDYSSENYIGRRLK